MIRICLVVPFLISGILFSQSPNVELRGVWISTVGGDWPTSANVAEQQRSLIEIFDQIKKANFNTVFFQVRSRGNVLYRSAIEPWATQLTGILGKDPGYDPLEFALREAHQRGLELHAWFNVGKVWGSENLPSNTLHLTRTHRDWVKKFDNEWWLDMGIPDAREYTENLVKELILAYDIDGIHFDYIRYPSPSFDDWKTFTTWSDGMERAEWRRNNINAFVRDAYEIVQKEKPWIKVGSTPIGIYQSINGAQSTFNGFSGVFQDSRRWLREGIHDYLAPQIYWTIGEQQDPNDPDFSALSLDWITENHDRHMYIGIGAYRPNIKAEIFEQVNVIRELGADGEIFFRYKHLTDILQHLKSVYPTPALVPPMTWKDSIPPNPPKDIISRVEQGGVSVHWTEPEPAADSEKPFHYAVYRSSVKGSTTYHEDQIIAILPASQLQYRDETSNGSEYLYSVSAVDRAGNVSIGPEKTITKNKTILDRYDQPGSTVSLSQNTPNPITDRTFVSIDLPQRMFVTFSLKHESAQQETVIVRETKEMGLHVIAVDTKNFPVGEIEYRLKAGDVDISRIMEKR